MAKQKQWKQVEQVVGWTDAPENIVDSIGRYSLAAWRFEDIWKTNGRN